MSPLQGSGIVFSPGQQRSCESERNISKLFSQILQGTFQNKPNCKAVAWLDFPAADTEHKRRCLPIPLRSMRSQYRWGVGGKGGGVSHVNVGEEEWDVDRALSTSSLRKWRHRSELRLHSCLMAGDSGAHAWTRRSSKRMRRSSLPPLVPRKTMAPPPPPPSGFTLYTPGMSRASGDGKERGAQKKSIWFHSPLTRSLTDGDLPPLNKGKETAWSQRHKMAESGC